MRKVGISVMRKVRAFVIFILALAILALALFIFFSCKKNNENKDLIALDAVNVASIHYDGKTISWDKADNAASYRVVIGDLEAVVEQTTYSYEDPGSGFIIKITSLPSENDKTYKEGSETVKEVKYLPQVTGLRVEAGILYWDAVAGAESYIVKTNGVEKKISGTSFDGLPTGISASTFVKPIVESESVICFSTFSNETITCLLPAPVPVFTNSSRTVSWEAVQNAEGYRLILEKDGQIIQSENIGNLLTFSYPYTEAGNYIVRVLANPQADSGLTASKYSAPLTIIRLSNPAEITMQQALNNNTNVTFADVAYASSFEVFVNGVEVGTSTRNSFEYHFNASASEQIHTVKIIAKGNGHTILDADGSGSTFEITKLAIPRNLQLTSGGQQIRWDSVNKATGYVVYINGDSFIATGTEYELPALAAGTHNIRVCARGNGTNIADSDLSVYLAVNKLAAPSNLHITSSVLEWNPVQGVENYVVYIDSVKYNVSTHSMTIDPNYISATSLINVVAKGNGSTTLDSSASANLLVHRLSAPTNLSFTNDNILWNSVSGATAYSLKVNDLSPKKVIGTSYSWEEFSPGEKRVSVQALGDGQTYFDSPVSIEAVVTKLAAPVLSIGEAAYEWTGVFNAINYQILCNGYNQVLDAGARSYAPQYTEAGQKNFKVRAIGNGVTTVSSAYTEISHNVEARTAPTGNNVFTVTKSGSTFTVALNDYTEGLTYLFNIAGEDHEITSNTFSFDKTDAGAFVVKIAVKGDGMRYVNSIYTPSKTYTCLNAATNISWAIGDNNVYQVSWTASQKASRYHVEFDLYNGTQLVRNSGFDQATTSFNVSLEGGNKLVVRVTALGDGVETFDSVVCEKTLVPIGE